jgi:hypothetical protein
MMAANGGHDMTNPTPQPEAKADAAPAIDFDQIWEAVKTLPKGKLRKLRTLVTALLFKRRPLTKLDELDFLLLKDGLIRRIPRPPTAEDIARFRSWVPIQIEGEPLSEQIIRERR